VDKPARVCGLPREALLIPDPQDRRAVLASLSLSGGASVPYLGHGRSPYLGHGRSPYLDEPVEVIHDAGKGAQEGLHPPPGGTLVRLPALKVA